jgi:hypothetical protein
LGPDRNGPGILKRRVADIASLFSATHGQSALFHAREALGLCQENGIGDFDLAFGYEAMARAYSILGNHDDKATYMAKAIEAAMAVAEEDDRKYVESEISTIK